MENNCLNSVYLLQGIVVHLFIRKTSTKEKHSPYKPGKAPRVPGIWGSQISRQSAHEGGKIVSRTGRPPSTPHLQGNIPGTLFY